MGQLFAFAQVFAVWGNDHVA
ncbi:MULTISPECIES: membrane protein YoeI [Buttiauxella]|nr:membrane protein YoeI [Buttiauxella sp. 3AFRM03]MCA1922449.1 membrane protein YoeI [Buttiauxella noackiae]MRT13713.1 membrane protein YoeI [Enterobacteriaceae bacterium RIT711]